MNDSRWTTCCAVRAGTAEEGGMLLRQDSSITEAEEDHYGDGHKLLLSPHCGQPQTKCDNNMRSSASSPLHPSA